MNKRDKKMIRDMSAVITESIIEMLEGLEKVQKESNKFDAKKRKAARKAYKAKMAKKDKKAKWVARPAFEDPWENTDPDDLRVTLTEEEQKRVEEILRASL